MFVDYLEKRSVFSDFLHRFRSSQSIADLLSVVSDIYTRTFNRSGATRAVALDISKAFNRVWHVCPIHKRKSYGISVRHLALFRLFSVIKGFQ